MVLTFVAFIRSLLSDRAKNVNRREKKQCTLGLYKFKHCMTSTREVAFDRVKGSLNLFVPSGVIDKVFTTDRNE